MIKDTLYDFDSCHSLIAHRALPLSGSGLKPDDYISDDDFEPQLQELLYYPTGVQTKEGFEYKFVRPLRG